MADLNYINPTALKPEIGWAPKNALAGLQYVKNEQDYRRALEQQMRLQDLGEQERRYKFDEMQSGRPLRDLEQQIKMESGQGQLPLAREAAGSAMQRDISKSKYETKADYGETALQAALRKHTKGMDDANWDKFTKENQYALSLLENARMISQTQGQAAAVGYVQQRKRELEKQGFKFPQHFENPQYWEPLYQATVNSVKHIQEMSKERLKGEMDNEGRRISADATRYAADAAAGARIAAGSNSQERNRNVEQEVTYLRGKLREAISRGDNESRDSLVKNYVSSLTDAYMEMNKQYYAMAAMDPSGNLSKRLEAGRGEYIDTHLQQMGFQRRDPQEQKPTSLKNNSDNWTDLGDGVRRRRID